MRKSLVIITAAVLLAIPLLAQDVTPVQVLSPGAMEFGPFIPAAEYFERLGTETVDVDLICQIKNSHTSAVVYDDTVKHDFGANETYVALFSEADLETGGYVITFWAEDSPTHENISFPPLVHNFGYAAAVNEEAPPSSALNAVCFNPDTRDVDIRFSLAHTANLDLAVYDLAGKIVTSLTSQRWNQGEHTVTWNTSNAPSGIYFVRLLTPERSATRKLLLLN